MSDNTKASSPGETENVAAVPPPISFDPTTLSVDVIGAGSDTSCYVKDGKLMVAYCDLSKCGGMIGVWVVGNTYAFYASNTGHPMNDHAASIGRLAAFRTHRGAWKVFDPRVSALLPRIDAQLEY